MEIRDDLGEKVLFFPFLLALLHLALCLLEVALPASSLTITWVCPCSLNIQVSLTTETLNYSVTIVQSP